MAHVQSSFSHFFPLQLFGELSLTFLAVFQFSFPPPFLPPPWTPPSISLTSFILFGGPFCTPPPSFVFFLNLRPTHSPSPFPGPRAPFFGFVPTGTSPFHLVIFPPPQLFFPPHRLGRLARSSYAFILPMSIPYVLTHLRTLLIPLFRAPVDISFPISLWLKFSQTRPPFNVNLIFPRFPISPPPRSWNVFHPPSPPHRVTAFKSAMFGTAFSSLFYFLHSPFSVSPKPPPPPSSPNFYLNHPLRLTYYLVSVCGKKAPPPHFQNSGGFPLPTLFFFPLLKIRNLSSTLVPHQPPPPSPLSFSSFTPADCIFFGLTPHLLFPPLPHPHPFCAFSLNPDVEPSPISCRHSPFLQGWTLRFP